MRTICSMILFVAANTACLSQTIAKETLNIRIEGFPLFNGESQPSQEGAPTGEEHKDSTMGQTIVTTAALDSVKSRILSLLGEGNVYVNLHPSQFKKKGYTAMGGKGKVKDCIRIHIKNDAIHASFPNQHDRVSTDDLAGIVSKKFTLGVDQTVAKEDLWSTIPVLNDRSWEDLTVKEVTEDYILCFDFSDPTKYDFNGTLTQIAPLEDQMERVIQFRRKTREEKAEDMGDKPHLSKSSTSKRDQLNVPQCIVVILALGGTYTGYIIYQKSRRSAEEEEQRKQFSIKKGYSYASKP